jgi:DNA-binding transcriptional regulator YdaS (Cro superfamily)
MLKAILRHAIERVGGQIKAAQLLGVSTSEVSLWSNDNHSRFIPIDHLIDLDAAAGDVFLQDWARKRGYDLTPREPTSTKDNIFKIIGEFSKAGGNLDCTALEAAADNHITPNERRAIYDAIAPVRDSIDELERYIRT